MGVEDRDDLVRLLATVQAFQPVDQSKVAIRQDLVRKLEGYLSPAWLGVSAGLTGYAEQPGPRGARRGRGFGVQYR